MAGNNAVKRVDLLGMTGLGNAHSDSHASLWKGATEAKNTPSAKHGHGKSDIAMLWLILHTKSVKTVTILISTPLFLKVKCLSNYFGISLLLCLVLSSCKIEEHGRGVPLTNRAIMNLRVAVRSFIRNQGDARNLERMDPENLYLFIEGNDLPNSGIWEGKKEVLDAWENPFLIKITEKKFSIRSFGEDGVGFNDDDIDLHFDINP
jgi:hypothetical protein